MSGIKTHASPPQKPTAVPQKSTAVPATLPAAPLWVWISISILAVLAILVRFYHIGDPGMDYMSARQYRSALIARDYYYQSEAFCPSWKLAIAKANNEGIIEPPISEFIAVQAYHLIGHEELAVPRALSCLYWVTGGVLLFLVLLHLFSPATALFGSAFFLFLPGGEQASRSFQPDPLMVMLILLSWYLSIRYDAQPSPRRLLVASIGGALAILIKMQALFFVYPFFLGLLFARFPTRKEALVKLWEDRAVWTFIGITMLPLCAYYLYGLVIAKFLQGAAQTGFTPQIIFTNTFWVSWLESIGRVVGYYPLAIAFLGIVLVTDARLRILQQSLWLAYLLYGFVFSYGASTHHYYQLPFIPIVALGICPLIQLALPALLRREQPRVKPIVMVVFWLTIAFNIVFALEGLAHPEFERKADDYRAIGETIEHSTRVICLTDDYGETLKYYGELCCTAWPTQVDFGAAQWKGQAMPSAEDRLRGMLPNNDYFVVTDLAECARQHDLAMLLTEKYPVVKQTDSYFIFDLRPHKQAKKP